MKPVATKTNPDLWAAKVAAAKRKFGKWSARASQWAVREYKGDGGGYRGKKSSSNSMAKWTRQKWRTRDGDKAERTDRQGRKVTARYLPDAKWKGLSPGEAAATDAKKRKASREGKQVVANTDKAKVRELAEPREFMNIKTRIKELAAKSDAVRELARGEKPMTEFARGDYAIPALKKILARNPMLSPDDLAAEAAVFNKLAPVLKGKYPAQGMIIPRGPHDSAGIFRKVPEIRKAAADAIRWGRGSR